MATLRYGRSRLPELIKLSRTTKTEFARRMGFSPSMVTHIIKGETRLSLLQAKRASGILSCKIEDLYEWEDGN